MFRILSFAAALFLPVLGLFAQIGGPIVFTVGQDTVWGAEFERVYSKNNKKKGVKPSLEELQEYQDLYVKFKLKVMEAYSQGMDTNTQFIKELAGYRKQLAQPYLTDKEVTEKLMREAYERMQWEVDASNLMIHLNSLLTGKDTVAVYNRISNWKKQINNGADFSQLAADSSTDEYGRKYRGHLGYFTAFGMIYPFENQAYNTPVGQVSEPFRTQFGYHLLKVNAKRPARGEVHLAHILIRVNNESEVEDKKLKIDAIYERLKKGESWDDLVLQFSEDFELSNRNRGGDLNWVKSIGGNVPNNVREAAFAIPRNGDFSEPIKSEMGWHILKRLDHRGLKSFEESEDLIKFKISRDSRSELNREAVLNRVKKENKFVEVPGSLDKYIASLDSTFLLNIWEPTETQVGNTPLFTINGRPYTYQAFTGMLYDIPQMDRNADIPTIVKTLYHEFVVKSNLGYEEEILETKYDDFKYLMQEYRDGILLFELTNEMVWAKASQDTTGLKEFFEANRDKYQWKDRLVYRTYHCSTKKTAKKVKKMIRKKADDTSILAKMNKIDPLAVRIDQKVTEKGSDSLVDALDWNKSFQVMKDGSKNIIYVVKDQMLNAGPKKMQETLGPVTSDYQDKLESEWIAELKEKYPVKINDGALNNLFSN
jgi:peptidyl-prolyl cis-trans isomerase SurA